jgi:thiamine-monophosphate kinase
MDLKELGEFGLIDRVAADTVYDTTTLLCGIGDDAAVLKPTLGMVQLATADMLVEDIHFTLTTITPWQLGYKSLAVNISDIAAMGGIPRHALVSLGMPSQLPVSFVEQLYTGMKHLAALHHVNIVGGDTVASPKALVINVTVLGEVEPERVIYRSGARAGDVIVVSGTLGDSAAGLRILMQDMKVPCADFLIKAHVTPQPRVDIGRICSQYGVHSLNDISDGLASEIHEICNASGVGARIYEAKLPVSQALATFAAEIGKEATEYVLYGGEDYQLIFTAAPQQIADMQRQLPHITVAVVGEIIVKRGVTLISRDGTEQPILPRGYNHFR